MRMTTQISTKVRLVRCPRCRGVLTELTELPLYKCGGCGTILESKTRKNGTNHDGVHLQETNQVLDGELHSIVKENEVSISNLDLTPSGGIPLPDGDKPRDQRESGDNNGDQCEDTRFSHELSSSLEVSGNENKDLSNHDGVHLQETNRVLDSELDSIVKENEVSISNLDLTPSGGISLPDGYKPRDQGESGDNNGDQCEDTRFSHELSSSLEVSGNENKDLSKVVIEQLKQDKEGKCPLGQNIKRRESEFQDCNGERLAGKHPSAEFPSSSECTSHQADVSTPEITELVESDDKNPSEQCTGRDQKEHGDSRTEWCGSDNLSDQVGSLPEHDHLKKRLPPDDEHSEADESTLLSPKNSKKSLNSFTDYNGEQCKDWSFFDELPSTHEVSDFENKVLSAEVTEQLKQDDEGQYPFGKSSKRCESEIQDWNGERVPGRNPSDEVSQEADVSTPIVRKHVKSGEKNPLEQCTGRDKRECGDYQKESCPDDNFLDEVRSLSEHDQQKNKLPPDGREQRECGDSRTEPCAVDNFLDEVRSLSEHDQQKNKLPPDGREHREGDESTHLSPENNEKGLNGWLHDEMDNNSQDSSPFEIASPANGKSSLVAGGVAEANEDIKNFPLIRSSGTENHVNGDTGDSLAAANGCFNENNTSLNRFSPDAEQLEHSHREDTRSFGRVSSVDTSLPTVDPSSKHDVKHVDMSKSPMTKRYYIYEGSISSYDGADDQVPNHVSQPPRRKCKDKFSTSTAELQKKDGLNKTSMSSSESEMQYWAGSSSSSLQGKQYHSMEGSSIRRQFDLPETRRRGHKSGNRMRLDKETAAPRLAFTSRDFQAGHRNGSPSSYHRSSLQNHRAYQSSDRPTYSEPDKVDLLRTVFELKDQLNRMQLSKLTASGRFPAGVVKENLTPLYYKHLAPEREVYADLSHPTYPVRHSPFKGWPQRRKDLRMAFSGESAHYRHQVNCSCLHCCPQDWHRSAQLPSHSVLCNNGHCVVHTGHNCCNVLAPSSSSPQHYTSSEQSLWGLEKMSDERKHKDKEMKRLYLREKHHIMKRHLRPISGGAPLISCYHCSELLQLPSDFLLFKKKYHQLRCNACGKVLKFSLLERMHIVPYFPEASAPPPSEADDYSDAISHRILVPTSHANSCSHAEPVSCSDDYGLSFCRSCSTEGEASFLTPSADRLEWNAYNRKMSSSSSFEPMEDTKMKSVWRGHRIKNESSLQTSKPTGASPKVAKWKKGSFEIEELPEPSNFPLHRLMGYSSPSEVLDK
ncbi:Hypothetical predicted protein [Olea europaea subsp. europaea]|uniref:Zinc-ribbon domain-containing protein n=1 Tax=Olea europaea subsp. europaea TaxID=158383 RepID=A0A8S0TDV7_OLEEU|nr:Hypothetical predicted protein [Olea europaea subsp. europaea]